MATLKLQTVGESITWPSSGAGKGMTIGFLMKRPAGSTQTQFVFAGISLTGGGTNIFGIWLYGASNTNKGFVQWNGANAGINSLGATPPADNKRTLVMVGYEDNGSTIDVRGRWKNEDAAGASASRIGSTRPSWPPSTGEVFIETDVVGLFLDEVVVYNEKYSDALFDAVYDELLT